jgi:DNA-binding response OmpR family regulator
MLKQGIILLLENSTEYLFQLDQAFRSAEVTQGLRVARYGNEAILYLKGIGIYGDREHYPLPDLIIIDLLIPDGSALAVYGWVRRNPEFAQVPIVLLNDPNRPRTGVQNIGEGNSTYELSLSDGDGLVQLVKHFGERPESLEGIGSDENDAQLIS